MTALDPNDVNNVNRLTSFIGAVCSNHGKKSIIFDIEKVFMLLKKKVVVFDGGFHLTNTKKRERMRKKETSEYAKGASSNEND